MEISMLKILIVDSNILFREGLSNLLEKEPDIVVVGGAGSICEAVEMVKNYQPDLLLLDAEITDIVPLNGIRMLLAERNEMRVLLLSTHGSIDQLFYAVRNGARGYLQKTHSIATLMPSIRAVQRGEAAIPRAMVGVLLDEFYRTTSEKQPKSMESLTPREIDVLIELGCGHSNREISDRLNIAENTVKAHVHNLLEKLNMQNRRQAAAFARTKGISLAIQSSEISVSKAQNQI
jgi:two-component system, NarL family, nitrate/nitrite response regulator NarL